MKELSDREAWDFVFKAFGGERHTPPSVDRHPEVCKAVQAAYKAGYDRVAEERKAVEEDQPR